MKYDLLIQNGTLVDPGQGIHDRRDVAFAGGAVAEVGQDLPSGEARAVIDAGGCYVTPGWIDVHVHVFPGVTHYGIEPDPTCLARGATTVVDAGSAGADIFPGFRKFVIEVSQTRILAELNISSQGMITSKVGELSLLDLADVDACRRMIEANRDLLIGVKAAAHEEHHRRRGGRPGAIAPGPRGGRRRGPADHDPPPGRLVRDPRRHPGGDEEGRHPHPLLPQLHLRHPRRRRPRPPRGARSDRARRPPRRGPRRRLLLVAGGGGGPGAGGAAPHDLLRPARVQPPRGPCTTSPT